MIRVVIVDDSAALRIGLNHLLESTGEFLVVGVCSDGSEVVECALTHRPHVVLMDVAMPGMDGIAATVALRAAAPQVRVLILTSGTSGETVHRARDAGVSGYLSKSADPDELITAIHEVAVGRQVWSRWATEALRHAR